MRITFIRCAIHPSQWMQVAKVGYELLDVQVLHWNNQMLKQVKDYLKGDHKLGIPILFLKLSQWLK